MHRKIQSEMVVLILGLCISLGFVASYYIEMHKTTIITELPTIENSNSWTTCIDSVESQNGQVVIKGWFIKQGESLAEYDVDVLLWNDSTGQGYEREAQYETRTDVTDAVNDSVNYDNSGFNAKFLLDEDEQVGEYRIIICPVYDGMRQYIDTGEVVNYE